jgi:hypothetical protein
MVVTEMCAYPVSHLTDELTWRCVVCEDLTKHSEEGIIPHLVSDHGLKRELLKNERADGIFLYPEKAAKK